METAPSELTITEHAPAPHHDDDKLAHIACGQCYTRAKAAGLPITAYCGKQKHHWPRIPRVGPDPCIICTYYVNQRIPCRSCGLPAYLC